MHVAAVLLLCVCAAAAPAGAAELEALLAAADSVRGEQVFRKCVACHTVEKGGRKKTGPNLWGIVGAPVGARDGFRYSKAMLAFGGIWTPERLDAYLAKPREFVKGGSMSFVGDQARPGPRRCHCLPERNGRQPGRLRQGTGGIAGCRVAGTGKLWRHGGRTRRVRDL